MVLLFTLWHVLKHLGFFPTHRPLNITELPYDALQHIFTHIPLVDLLGSVPAVSPSWAEHTSDALRTRHSLVLQIGGSYTWRLFAHQIWPQVAYNQAHFNLATNYLSTGDAPLSPSAADPLLTCLPKVTILFLYLEAPEESSTEQALRLLTHWSAHLQCLLVKVGAQYTVPYNEQSSVQCLTLLRSLIGYPKLLFLYFKFNGRLLPPRDAQEEEEGEETPSLDLPLLRQLTNFTMATTDETGRLLGASYIRYLPQAPSALCGLKLANLGAAPFTGRNSLFQYSPAAAGKFTHLDVFSWEEPSLPSLNRLVDLFSNLTILYLPLTSQLRLATLVAPLRRSLPCLSYLYLRFKDSPDLSQEIAAIERLNDLEAVSVPSVGTLRLCELTCTSHRDLECLQLHRLFPGLRHLHFSQAEVKCTVCATDTSPPAMEAFTKCILRLTERFEHLFIAKAEEEEGEESHPQIHLYEDSPDGTMDRKWLLHNPKTNPHLVLERDFS